MPVSVQGIVEAVLLRLVRMGYHVMVQVVVEEVRIRMTQVGRMSELFPLQKKEC